MKFRWLRSLTIMPRELPKKIKRENQLLIFGVFWSGNGKTYQYQKSNHHRV
jgi:hypothetical protein